MLATENLYLAAYARTSGARLKRVVVSRSNGRQTAVFELDGIGMDELQRAYYGGDAVVNLAAYRQSLEELKDHLFDALRRRQRRADDGRTRRRWTAE